MSPTGAWWSRPCSRPRAEPGRSRETGFAVPPNPLAALAARHGLPAEATERLAALLAALAREPDPPTTVHDPAEALDRHVADSLSGLEVPSLAAAGRIADVGSGAGFPGLALAVALPRARIDLVESARRKCDVIERLAEAAGLRAASSGAPGEARVRAASGEERGEARVRAVCARAEEWAAGEGSGVYEAVTARAVAPLAVLAEYAAPLLTVGGVLVAWKGGRDEAEEAGGRAAAGALGLEVREVVPVVPFAGARRRHLHVYEKTTATPRRYPRRAGMARKRPLG